MKSQRSHNSAERAAQLTRWLPFLAWSRGVGRQSLLADLMAGLTGAIIVLPQGVAYALIAGLPPEYGLYTAIVTPVIAGLFGSSLHLISGPTAAISIVVLSVVSSVVPPGSAQFIPVALALTVMAGIIQLALGLARLGTLVNFISHTVVIGFTAGAAILIATSQLKHALGVAVPTGASFFESWIHMLRQIDEANHHAVLIALTTIGATLLVKRLFPKLPAMLVGMVAGSLLCWLVGGEDKGVALVGALPGELPGFSLPEMSPEVLRSLAPGALAVAILALVEAVSIARAIAIRSGQRIDGNQEFIGQGLSNLVGGLFSCYAGSGSFTRTGVNYESGARTPLAAIFAALFLVLILLLAPDVTALLPLPAMAGAILLIAWNLIDRHHIAQILRSNRQEAAVLIVTFASTLFVELEFAIYLGVLLSLILYLRRTSRPRLIEVAPRSLQMGTELRNAERFGLPSCPQLRILRIDGSLYFGAVDHVQRSMQRFHDASGDARLLINCAGINFIDVAGAELLVQEARRLQAAGGSLSFCNLKNTVKDELEATGFIAQLGEEHFYATTDDALAALVGRLDQTRCDRCDQRIFQQCPGRVEAECTPLAVINPV